MRRTTSPSCATCSTPGVKFKGLFCIYPGIETELLEKNVGNKGLQYVMTYVTSAELEYKPNFGMTLPEFRDA